MSLIPAKDKQQHETILALNKEIELLEEELQQLELALNSFETKIRFHLHQQIIRLRELTSLYKAHKAAKKAKRLEQKKRGKNYKEPQGMIKTPPLKPTGPVLNINDQQRLKQLYKEAIVLVHPDKFVLEDESVNKRAIEVTIQLNELYKSGRLDELSEFHEHIISGNAMSHSSSQISGIADPAALLLHLRRKKDRLETQLKQHKQSTTYTVLHTYEDPYVFINELRIQFEERIRIMEKRTRKA